MRDAAGQETTGEHWVDLLHPLTADVVATYAGDFFDGRAAITRNQFGAGEALYVGTRPDAAYLREMLCRLCAEKTVYPLVSARRGVEASLRSNDSSRYLFVINHTSETNEVDLLTHSGTNMLTGELKVGVLSLAPYAVEVIELD